MSVTSHGYAFPVCGFHDAVLRDRVHQRRGRERHAPVPLEEPDDSHRVHQLRLVEVQVHPVDALHLEDHMVIEHVTDSLGYLHGGLRSTQALNGQPAASGGSQRYPRAPHLGSTGAYKHHPQRARADRGHHTASSGGGGAPLVLRRGFDL